MRVDPHGLTRLNANKIFNQKPQVRPNGGLGLRIKYQYCKITKKYSHNQRSMLNFHSKFSII